VSAERGGETKIGHGHKVTATSDSTLKIRRAPVMTAKVKVKRYEDRTNLQVANHGDAASPAVEPMATTT
jgi:hypothetical protein